MGQVIPIETGKRVRRMRRFAVVRERVAPVCTGAVRLIGRLLLDTAWLFIAGGLRFFGRYIRFALTCAVLVALVALGVEYFHHWPHPRNAVIATCAAIALLGLREALYRLERLASDHPPLWR
ncbi:hypothetical protein [Paraburkholderia azotifigens]|uniref:Uncharacterized protein n=1 Tax=Paraburkholderia azotifigens TaxID=2057004 RepID=A0A5C6VLZ4_9BURK|nr:hypothetical protein [Paraburkholderia azotifigens]TXC85546.1 hypothetical protein FRZ40_17155 [Paraburkholderia azotifigens]